MASEKELLQLEKRIIKKMILIKNNKETPKESGIGKLFTILKSFDIVLYEKILNEYKKILKQL
jgi:HEPN domain-containing protein